ncbi:hypothetical protein CHS0354_032156 [Potamilus streckersoni]|uniref:Uncharacterized protein n=1 Tax=Potamilus streckersoni TaxID=2493646 RepID=A0AAE0TGQ3_9BIVA|nr:hypothetical protein CHS0354_032156 [Potamilus streckersoni]
MLGYKLKHCCSTIPGGRWIPDYRLLESINDPELMKEDSPIKDIDKVQLQFNLHGLDDDEPFSTPIPDSLEDQVEGKMKEMD